MDNSALWFFMIMKLTGQPIDVLEKDFIEYVNGLEDEEMKKGLLGSFENFKQTLLVDEDK